MAGAPSPSPIEVVQAFLDALQRQDADAALALTDDDVLYQNVPLPPARGRAEFEKQMRWMADNLTGFEVEMHNIAADGATVLTERTDVLVRNRFRAAFWVCGTFEVRDGKVAVWRDRFDYADMTVAIVKGAARAAVGAIRASRQARA